VEFSASLRNQKTLQIESVNDPTISSFCANNVTILLNFGRGSILGGSLIPIPKYFGMVFFAFYHLSLVCLDV